MGTMRRFLVIILLAATSISFAWAAGSIKGQVLGKGEKDPLVGVNVLVQGSVRGASTDVDGRFQIADISPGVYTLVFSIIGYQRETVSGVLVEEGKVTEVKVSLIQAPVQTEQVVVTASKRAQSLEEVPVSIATLDAAEMRYRNSVTLEDAVRYVPGVNLTGGQINIRGSSGYSRGAGSRVLMLIDGVPFIASDTGELVFESIPVGQVDRIEVVKGASSALYGSNALGGVVNVITKPIPETPETDIRTFGGMYNRPSFGQWVWSEKNRFFSGLSLTHAQKFGDFGLALFGSRQIDDGFRRNDYRRRYNFFAKGKYEFSATNSLTTNFGLLHQYGGQFQYWADFDSALSPPEVQRDDRVKSTRFFLSGLYNDALQDNFLLTVKGIWNHNNWFSTSVHDFKAENWELLPNGRYAETLESLSDGFRLDASATWIAADDHTLTFGVNGQYDDVRADSKLFGKHTGWGAALFAQDEWKLTDQLNLTLGARLDAQSVGLLESGPQFNPKVALSYLPIDGTSLRASYGRGFRIPAVAEIFVTLDLGGGFATLPNTGLKPETSNSYELGISQRLSNIGSLDVAAFGTRYNNLIDPQITSNGVQWRNTPKALVQGVETSLKLGLFDGDLQYSLAYTYVYPEDLSPQDPLLPRPNNILPYRPRHLLYTGLLGHRGIFRAGVDFRYISKVDRVFSLLSSIIKDLEQRVEIVVTDFRFGADLRDVGVPLNISFNINNAFRYNYLELTANMSPPRTFVVVLEARL